MKPSRNILLAFGINGSLRKREVQAQASNTEYYLFNSAANMKAYSNNGLDFAYYGYNAANTRAYKLSMLNQNQWVNGQPEPLNLQLQSAMFYPNAYLNFNQNGEYTKHYYNGSERICSRLGDNIQTMDVVSNNDRLGFRIMQADQQARADLLKVVEAGDIPIETPSVEITSLHPTNATSNIFYYHTNHLGSTAFVTDQNRAVTQGFLYAPFGEITTEYNANFGNNVLPKYSFNAKELDEETGMYYYEARYYKPPVFTSRDPMFEKYFWMTPYAYCANNPVKYVDPSGEEIVIVGDEEYQTQVIEYLDKLCASGKAGRFLVNQAIKSKRTFVIANTKADVEMGLSENNRATILPFNLSNTSGTYNKDNGNVKYTPLTILAHELAHFIFPQDGFLLNDKGENTNIRAGEVLAVEWENRVRKDLKMDERKIYRGLDVYGKKIVESSKYKGFYNMQEKPNYMDDSYSVPDYKKPSHFLELRQAYQIRGSYFDSKLVKPQYRYQLRLKF